jgi:hypothetical protein
VRRHIPLLAALAAALSCLETTATEIPVIETAAVAANPHQALAAVVTARVRDADSIAVRVRLDGAGEAELELTPAVLARDDESTIPVLGLLPERRYIVQLVAFGAGRSVVGPPLELVTGPLPDDLPRFSAEGSDPSPGWVLFSAGAYMVVVDDAGRVVWYRRTPGGPSLGAMAQGTGRYVVRPSALPPEGPPQWIEVDPSGEVTRMLGCVGELPARPHDLIAEADGGYWILCDETRTMNLASFGGSAGARVTGTVVQHVGADGSLLFAWSAFDHFALTDLPPSELAGESVNWTHGNAIDLDADGDLLVSFRSLNEVAKIDVPSGAVRWRFGGRANEFTLVGAATPPFARQHGVRASASGELVLLDNRGDPAQSRAERWSVDPARRIARLVGSFASSPAVTTDIGGSVQPLPGGRLLVSFGTAGRVEEYDADGNVVWRMLGDPGYVFRAQRITSLYAPGVGSAR